MQLFASLDEGGEAVSGARPPVWNDTLPAEPCHADAGSYRQYGKQEVEALWTEVEQLHALVQPQTSTPVPVSNA